MNKGWLLLLAALVIAVGWGSIHGSLAQESTRPDSQSPSFYLGDSTTYSTEPTTIELLMYSHGSWPFNPQWPVIDWIREKTNITVQGSVPYGNFNDSVALAVASGLMPDVIHFTEYESAARYGQEGALLNLADHMDKLPHLKAFWDEYPEIRARSTDSTGAVYVALTHGLDVGGQRVWMYREDIFSKHGIDPPANWDDLVNASIRLKKLYPHSYPFVFRGGHEQLFTLAPSFGTWYDLYPQPETGQVAYGPIDPRYKEMLIYLHHMYAEELLPPDLMTLDTKRWLDLLVTGQSFVTVDYIGRIDYINRRLKEGNMQFLPPPAGTADEPGYVPNGAYMDEGLSIAADTNNLDAALRYIDFLYSEEGRTLTSWGKEGVTWKTEGHKKQFLSQDWPRFEFSTLRNETGVGTNGFYGWFDHEAYIAFVPEKELYVYDEAPKYGFDEPILPPLYTREDKEFMIIAQESLRKHLAENVSEFITGARPLEEWPAYLEEAQERGVEKIIGIYSQYVQNNR